VELDEELNMSYEIIVEEEIIEEEIVEEDDTEDEDENDGGFMLKIEKRDTRISSLSTDLGEFDWDVYVEEEESKDTVNKESIKNNQGTTNKKSNRKSHRPSSKFVPTMFEINEDQDIAIENNDVRDELLMDDRKENDKDEGFLLSVPKVRDSRLSSLSFDAGEFDWDVYIQEKEATEAERVGSRSSDIKTKQNSSLDPSSPLTTDNNEGIKDDGSLELKGNDNENSYKAKKKRERRKEGEKCQANNDNNFIGTLKSTKNNKSSKSKRGMSKKKSKKSLKDDGFKDDEFIGTFDTQKTTKNDKKKLQKFKSKTEANTGNNKDDTVGTICTDKTGIKKTRTERQKRRMKKPRNNQGTWWDLEGGGTSKKSVDSGDNVDSVGTFGTQKTGKKVKARQQSKKLKGNSKDDGQLISDSDNTSIESESVDVSEPKTPKVRRNGKWKEVSVDDGSTGTLGPVKSKTKNNRIRTIRSLTKDSQRSLKHGPQDHSQKSLGTNSVGSVRTHRSKRKDRKRLMNSESSKKSLVRDYIGSPKTKKKEKGSLMKSEGSQKSWGGDSIESGGTHKSRKKDKRQGRNLVTKISRLSEVVGKSKGSENGVAGTLESKREREE
jgi:hypothetical protein